MKPLARSTLAARLEYRHATILACVLCALLTIVSLFVPPGMNTDLGTGMLEWRTLVEGGPLNSIAAPDPTDISKDRTRFVPNWSPGQYLVPGAFTLLGLPLGRAISVTVGLSLLCCLLGWIRVLKHFAVGPQAATLVVALSSAFQYATINFRIDYGGEPLAQAVTPWLILAGCAVPVANVLRAFLLAGLTILIAFLAKLTGVFVAVAALVAGSAVDLIRRRRMTPGMFAGACGAVLALAFLYVTWISRGGTPTTGDGLWVRLGRAAFATIAPWGAGVSWMDTLFVSGLQPERQLLILLTLLPPLVLFGSVILWAAMRAARLKEPIDFIEITVVFCVAYVLIMATMYLRGTIWDVDERYLRPAGTLIFVCAIAVTAGMPNRSAARIAVVGFCSVMALYGIYTFVHRVQLVEAGHIDRYSQTRQQKVNAQALEYARAAFAHEGRNAIFVVPSPDAASAFPLGARIVATNLDAEPESFVMARAFAGKLPGRLYVLVPAGLAAKGALLLTEFESYSPDGWQHHEFGDTTVFVHAPPTMMSH